MSNPTEESEYLCQQRRHIQRRLDHLNQNLLLGPAPPLDTAPVTESTVCHFLKLPAGMYCLQAQLVRS